MADAPTTDETYSEPLRAWRLWRLRRVETLRGERPLRLAAAGRFGIPKFWEPREATRAVCSSYRTTHEAPWPSCRCGIYGFREREMAERALRRYARDKLSRWALGRVSLWGRVVECTNGWRAELAYPYDLIVFTRDPDVAAELRSLYAVDVTTASARAVRRYRADTGPPDEPRGARAGRDAEQRQRARAAYEDWLRSVEALVGGRPLRGDQQLAQALSRLLVEEFSITRTFWEVQE
jgi:hypothetical protein